MTVRPTLFDADPHIARGATLGGPGDCLPLYLRADLVPVAMEE